MMCLPLLTIYTPTYNRGDLLYRLYNSLCKQSRHDFLWLVVDDGSTDNTKSIIDSFKKRNPPFQIIYVYQTNQGVHVARDCAYKLCFTELIMGLDSDDWLVEDAVATIYDVWSMKKNDNVAGIFAQNIDSRSKTIREKFPKNVRLASFQEFSFKFNYVGDKSTIIRSDVVKKIPKSPVYEGEKLIGENYKWIQIPNDLKFILLDKGIKYVEYQNEGFSKSSNRNFYNNPNGFRTFYRQYILSSVYIKQRIKGHIGFIGASIWLKKSAIKDSPRKFLTFILYPFGIVFYFIKRRDFR